MRNERLGACAIFRCRRDVRLENGEIEIIQNTKYMLPHLPEHYVIEADIAMKNMGLCIKPLIALKLKFRMEVSHCNIS
jgi:hypothetical protein